MRIKFQNPPINEVIVGVYFDRPMMVRPEHVGVFWNSVRDDFPSIDQQPELLVPMSEPELVFTSGFPATRHWLISRDEESLMQIQPNAFLFNWRKRAGHYPHYEAVKSKFDDLLSRYFCFMESEFGFSSPKARATELTYSNVVEAGEYWNGPSDTPKVVPGFSLPPFPLKNAEDKGFNFVSANRSDMGVNLQFSLRTGTSQAETRKDLLVLEFRALGQHGAVPLSETAGWFGAAHDAIGECFVKMTSSDVQKKYWRPV